MLERWGYNADSQSHRFGGIFCFYKSNPRDHYKSTFIENERRTVSYNRLNDCKLIEPLSVFKHNFMLHNICQL